MYINRKSSPYATPRNELHVGNETGESHWFTCLTAIIILAVLMALLLAFITFSSSSAMGLNQPMQAGTGECGYFRNVTLFHRNGLVNPHYCYDDTAEFSIDPFILHNASVQPASEVVVVDDTESNDNPVNPVVTPDNPVTPVAPVVNPVTPDITPDNPVVPDNTPVDEHVDSGNHYGNDKPDNNPNDVNNPHNGEDTYDEHHNP